MIGQKVIKYILRCCYSHGIKRYLSSSLYLFPLRNMQCDISLSPYPNEVFILLLLIEIFVYTKNHTNLKYNINYFCHSQREKTQAHLVPKVNVIYLFFVIDNLEKQD